MSYLLNKQDFNKVGNWKRENEMWFMKVKLTVRDSDIFYNVRGFSTIL